MKPFYQRYFGTPLFRGRVTGAHIQPLVEKIRKKASGWAGRLLSFQRRVTLASSILSSILIHNLAVYKWHIACIKEVQRIIKNFIWSGNLSKRKLVVVQWKRVTTPIKEGGLGIRNLRGMNLALLIKHCEWILSESNDWENFMALKFKKRDGTWLTYHKVFIVAGVEMGDGRVEACVSAGCW